MRDPAQFLQRLDLRLAQALTAEPHLPAEIFQCARFLAVQPKARNDELLLLRELVFSERGAGFRPYHRQ